MQTMQNACAAAVAHANNAVLACEARSSYVDGLCRDERIITASAQLSKMDNVRTENERTCSSNALMGSWTKQCTLEPGSLKGNRSHEG
jgi:hypothetical protein